MYNYSDINITNTIASYLNITQAIPELALKSGEPSFLAARFAVGKWVPSSHQHPIISWPPPSLAKWYRVKDIFKYLGYFWKVMSVTVKFPIKITAKKKTLENNQIRAKQEIHITLSSCLPPFSNIHLSLGLRGSFPSHDLIKMTDWWTPSSSTWYFSSSSV